MDRLQNQAFKFGYLQKSESILDIIHDRDLLLWNRFTSGRRNGLQELLPQKRERKLNAVATTDCHGSEHSVLRIVL